MLLFEQPSTITCANNSGTNGLHFVLIAHSQRAVLDNIYEPVRGADGEFTSDKVVM
jgi:hypothetical protein